MLLQVHEVVVMDESPLIMDVGGDQIEVDPTTMFIALGTMNEVT